ncbi:transhydrogenase beta subunit [Vibrio parahaemolyticus]|uniref:transhydrogenase beta subunit n=1 Tax=Vibrio parahaemolyticus TaxID=670 RepID=UPI00112015CB|nr:transhydrogenase beta subunit [Vibrio parahaemolyticus]EIW7481172.1 transhydrogenase beta subunit [Vibrio parahaemolyticus]EKZ9249911.1 transhydrogenase beta subunit [Vibrio parahaemolyticus]ELA6679101.1 transhydrogenase beta subunit [Vibrio parahaemolyticus]ELI6471667.1 transhydrogenase beta subunit [Vibrio parahaemolyticus]TOI57105.1 transhydrogenase beta subunit [Vibrio parahaemolyticus]
MRIGFKMPLCLIDDEEVQVSSILDASFRFSGERTQNVNNEVYEERLFKLIASHGRSLKQAEVSGCVCVLLPQLSDKTLLKKIMLEISSALGGHPSTNIYLYPYGQASFLMALGRIERELVSSRPTWVLGFNAKNDDVNGSRSSVVAAKCEPSKGGLFSRNVCVDLDATQQSIAVEKVMQQLGLNCKYPVSDFTVSVEGEEPIWMHHIQSFSPWITSDTRYHFLNVKLGSLGACSGILKAVCLYQQQMNEVSERFHAVQLDIELSGYVVGALFGRNESENS